jgi:hypothetical protein
MFLKRKLTKEQELHSKVKNLKGRNVRDKFTNLLVEVMELLITVNKLDKFYDKNIYKEIREVLNQYNSKNETTANEVYLHNMIYCYEDLKVLSEDIKYDIESSTYDSRIINILDFVKNYSSVHYVPQMNFYEEDLGKIQNQLRLVVHNIRYEVAKQNYNIQQKANQNIHLEEINISLLKELEQQSTKSFKYSELASRINSNHQEIELNKSQINIAYKNMDSFRMLANLLDILLFHDKYLDYLKEDGYIRKMIKKLYKNPEAIDIITNSLDIVESLNKIKAEINELNDVINPVNRVIFSDDQNSFKEEIVNLYKDISGGKN